VDDSNFKKALKTASHILSLRAHSAQELEDKLSKRYSASVVEGILKIAKKHNWLESEKALAEHTLNALHKKNKSWLYIQQFFKKKKLPLPPYDQKKELEKIRQLLLKHRLKPAASWEAHQKAIQFLSYRGFEHETIEEALSNF